VMFGSSLTFRAKLHHFKSLGLFVARALLDSRIIDVNLNRLFLKLVLGHRVPKSFASLKVTSTLNLG
jgi:E3 ubiquitin-protein ligase TRIP12